MFFFQLIGIPNSLLEMLRIQINAILTLILVGEVARFSCAFNGKNGYEISED